MPTAAPVLETSVETKAPVLRMAPASEPLGAPSALYNALQVTQGSVQVLEGQPGGWGATLLGTALRAGLIAGGFYLVGVRQWKPLLLGSLAASGIVTVTCFAGHAVLRRR